MELTNETDGLLAVRDAAVTFLATLVGGTEDDYDLSIDLIDALIEHLGVTASAIDGRTVTLLVVVP
jgi:hypothetical protein